MNGLAKKISDKYFEKYNESLEYKSVFYFKALINEVKVNKTYDRIVINENLEAWENKDPELVDKFLFTNIDNITDEAEDVDIVLICSDRRTKNDLFLTKLYNLGIYNMLLDRDRTIEPLCDIIKKPKTKKEAKTYLGINPIVSSGAVIDREDEVEEDQLRRIIKHYDSLGNDKIKYIEAFDRIVEQYSLEQLKVIVSCLKPSIQEVIKAEERYGFLFEGLKGVDNKKVDVEATAKKAGAKGLFAVIKEKKKEIEKQLQEKKQIEEERKEQERLEAERIKEAERIQKEKEEELRLEREKQEAIEKLDREQEISKQEIINEEIKIEHNDFIEEEIKTDKDKLLQEDTAVEEQIKKEQEDIAGEEAAREEQERLIREESIRKEQERLAREEAIRKEQERLAREEAIRKEQERLAREEAIREEQEKLAEQENEIKANTALSNMEDVNTTFEKPKYTLPADYKKVVVLVGANKSGTTFLVNAIGACMNDYGVPTAILDMTRDRSLYYIYNQDDSKLRKIASECMQKLAQGIDTPIPVRKNLNVYTAVPGAVGDNRKGYRHKAIIDTIKRNNNIIIIDADFSSPIEYFEQAAEIYLVQDMDILKIPETTTFLRELKNRGIDMNKIKLIVNKYVKSILTVRRIVEGVSYYNDPEMSFMDELFKNKLQYITVPYNIQNYTRYIENLYKNEINYKNYTQDFIDAIKNICMQIYPTESKKFRRKIF